MKASLFHFLLLLLLSNAVQAQTTFDKEKLDRYIEFLQENDKLMVSLSIAKEGKNVYSKASGYSFIQDDSKTLATTDSRYKIGSITKMFTAVMILQLTEENRLSLDDHLADFFPRLPNAKDITIDHLLAHRSGLYNFTDVNFLEWNTSPVTKEEMLEKFENQKPDFSPGEKAAYSNTNYVLLGYIIEHVTGNSYADEVQHRICKRAGLENTYFGGSINTENNEVYSYIKQNNNWEQQGETFMYITHGAGGLVSTPANLLTFAEALFRGKLINEKSLGLMLERRDEYGRGIFHFPFNEKSSFGHTGGIDGFHSMLLYFPDEKLALAFASNGANYSTNEFIIGVLSIYFNLPFDFPDFNIKAIEISSEELDKFEGTYASDNFPLKIMIKKKEGELTAQATGQSDFPLQPTGELEFRYEPAGIVMIFSSAEEGKVNEMLLKQAGAEIRFRREE